MAQKSILTILFFISVSMAALPFPFKLHVLGTGATHGQGVFACGDIDGDGKNDIINGQVPYTITWRKSTNVDVAYKIEDAPGNIGNEIHVADMDNDGDLDVIAPCDPGDPTPLWWENPRPTGDPTKGPWVRHGILSNVEHHDLCVGDIDGNGLMDVLERPKGTVATIWFQTAKNVWRKVVLNNLASEEGTQLADFTGDGRLDICDGINWWETPADVFNGVWIQHKIHDFPCIDRRVCIADLNGDGRPDVLVSTSEYCAGPLVWYEAPADPRTGTWIQHVLNPVGSNPAIDINFHTLQVGDIDHDGHPDILTGTTHGPCADPYKLIIYYNLTGKGPAPADTLTRPSQYGVWQAILADVGSDGYLDILNCDYDVPDQLEFWEDTLGRASAVAPRAGADARNRAGLSIVKKGDYIAIKNGNVSRGPGATVRLYNTAGQDISRALTVFPGGVRIHPTNLAGEVAILTVADGKTRRAFPVIIPGK
ncbi:MAG: VCBS repeat-containing protein [Chitinivibrionales bacterium]|nr:VCBS repeat-containing protein [Chitinivibrionales bacterium]